MITFENVTKIFQDTGTKALDGVSFHILHTREIMKECFSG